AGVSLAATQFAADTPLLVTGLIATGGVFMLWRLWIYGLGFLMIGFLFGRTWRHAHVVTDAELTEIRYSGRGVLALRGLKAIYYGTVMNCTIMAMVLVAATRMSELFLPWNEWLPAGVYIVIYDMVASTGILLASGTTGLETYVATSNNLISILAIVAFTALYSATGGLRAVIATDTVQFSLAMLGTLLYAVMVLIQCQGFDGMIHRLVHTYGESQTRQILSFGPTTADALFAFLVIVSLQWFFERNSDGTGYFAQRMMACRSDQDAELAAFSFTWLQVFLRSLLWLVIGVGLLVLYPFDAFSTGMGTFVADRELVFAIGMKELLPHGIRGIMLTGMLAALASTIDTHLTWGSGYWSNDIYVRIINKAWLGRDPSNSEQVFVARLSNILVLAVALIVMANLGSIQTAWYVTLLFGAGTGAVLVLRWVWERINLFSEISAIITSLVLAPVILFSVKAEWLRLLLMSSISTAVVITVTLITKPTEDNILFEFYRRVDPPGFWRQTAKKLGMDPQRPIKALKSGVYLTCTTSLTLFLLLIGCGKLVLPKPGASSSLTWVCLVIGIVSTTLWWRRLFPRRF
ncbi:MAG: Na+:solute symporter, partial [Planctomycetota bacterium]